MSLWEYKPRGTWHVLRALRTVESLALEYFKEQTRSSEKKESDCRDKTLKTSSTGEHTAKRTQYTQQVHAGTPTTHNSRIQRTLETDGFSRKTRESNLRIIVGSQVIIFL